MSVTEDELKRLRALCEAATPGPIAIHRIDLDGGEISWQIQSERRGGDIVGSFDDETNRRAKHDAVFFSESRIAMPALIDEVERLRAANDVMGGVFCAKSREAGKGACGCCAWCVSRWKDEAERLRAINQGFNAALKQSGNKTKEGD